MKTIGTVVTSLGTLATSTIMFGWALSVMWTWFIVPLGPAPLSLAHALGINATVNLFTFGIKREGINKGTGMIPFLAYVFGQALSAILIVGLGYLYKSF